MRAVKRVMRRGMLADGHEVAALEAEISEALGTPDAVVVSSATAGLALLLSANGVRPGTEVITSPLTFPGTVNAITSLGAKPVFVDCNSTALSHSSASAPLARTGDTSAACFVGRLGNPTPAENSPYGDAAIAGGLAQVEDGAYRLATPHEPVRLATAISLHASKVVSAGMGGAIVGASEEVLAEIRLRRNQGIPASSTLPGARVAVTNGFALRLPDLNAALARAQLRRLPRLLDDVKSIRQEVGEFVEDKTPWRVEWSTPAVLELRVAPGKRDRLAQRMQRTGLPLSIHYPLVSRMQPWISCRRVGEFSNADLIATTTLSLSIPPGAGRQWVKNTKEVLGRAAAAMAE